MGIWCFLKLVIVYVLRYDFLDTFRLRVYKSKKSSFEQKNPGWETWIFSLSFEFIGHLFQLEIWLV